MTNKAVLTGSTGGLGREIARFLAEQGYDLILLNRNKEQSSLQVEKLKLSFPSQTFEHFSIDLMDIENIREVSGKVAESHPHINALYNIAGLLTDQRMMSKQDIEGHFAVNTVAPYAVSNMLMPQLKSAARPDQPSIIVNFSSEVVNKIKTLDVDALRHPKTIGGLMDAYAKTKLALNIMGCFMQEALLNDHIYVYSVDPGPTKTQMTSGNKGMPFILRLIAPLIFQGADKQTRKLVDAIDQAANKKQAGLFISNGKAVKNPPLTGDAHMQSKLRELLDSLLK